MPPPPVPKKRLERGVIHVTVTNARSLRNMERFGRMDVYATVRVGGCAHNTSVAEKGGTDPQWNETLTFHVSERPSSILIDAWDRESVGKDDHIGAGELVLAGKLSNTAQIAQRVSLEAADGTGDAGDISLRVRFEADGSPLVISGHLEKKSPNWPKWDRRWFELRGDSLCYFSESASGAKQAAGEVKLGEATTARSSTAPDRRDCEWELVTDKRTYRLVAGSDEECVAWIDACLQLIGGAEEPSSPSRGDALAEGETTPRGRSAPKAQLQARKYLVALTGKPAKGQDLYESLKDGTLLCALANAIQPGVVPHCAESPATSVEEMENIGIFLSAAAKLGVEEENLFELTALWDGMTVGAEPAAIQMTLNRLAELHPQA